MSKQVSNKNNAARKRWLDSNSNSDKQNEICISPRSQRLLNNNKQCLQDLGYSLAEIENLVREYHEDEAAFNQQVSQMIDDAIEHPWLSANSRSLKPSGSRAEDQHPAAVANVPNNTVTTVELEESRKRAHQPSSDKGRIRIARGKKGEKHTTDHRAVAEGKAEKSERRHTSEGADNRSKSDVMYRSSGRVAQDRSDSRRLRSSKGSPSTERRGSRWQAKSQSRGSTSPEEKTKFEAAAVSMGAEGDTKKAWPRKKEKVVAAFDTTKGSEAKSEVAKEVTAPHSIQRGVDTKRRAKRWAEVVKSDQRDEKNSEVEVVRKEEELGSGPGRTETDTSTAKERITRDTGDAEDVMSPCTDEVPGVVIPPSTTVSFSPDAGAPSYVQPSAVSAADNVAERKYRDGGAAYTIIDRSIGSVDQHIVIKQRPADAPRLNRRLLQQSQQYTDSHARDPTTSVSEQQRKMLDAPGMMAEPQYMGGNVLQAPPKRSDTMLNEGDGREGVADTLRAPHMAQRQQQYPFEPFSRMQQPYGSDELYYAPLGLYPPRAQQYNYDDYVPYSFSASRAYTAEEATMFQPATVPANYNKATNLPPTMPRLMTYENAYGMPAPPHPGSMGMMPMASYNHHPHQPKERTVPGAISGSEHYAAPPYGLPPLFLQAAPPAMMHGQSEKRPSGFETRMEYASGPYKYQA